MAIDGRKLHPKLFTENVEYYEGDCYTKYGKCLGYYECAKNGLLNVLSCAALKEGSSFDSEAFLDKLHNNGFDNPFPHRLCTMGDGGSYDKCLRVPHDINF